MERPISLPKEFQAVSVGTSILGCLYALALWLGAGVLVAEIWGSSLPVLGKIAITLPIALVGGYGVLLCGFMGHDGTHFSLHPNRHVSVLLGILVTSPMVFYFLMGFTVSHWNHHKYTNSDRDPDSLIFSRFKNFFSRFFLARFYAFYVYGLNCVKLALGIPMPFTYSFPLPGPEVRLLAQVNLLANGLMAGGHLWLFFNFPRYWFGVAAVRLCGAFVSGLSPYIEHTSTGQGRGNDTRTSVSWWWDVVLLGNNYHLEHHLYPTVPFHKLKQVHHYLKEQGYYESPRHLVYGVLPTYRYTLSDAPYPLFR